MVWMGGSSHCLRTEDEEETKNEPSLIYVSMIPMATAVRACGAGTGKRARFRQERVRAD